MDPQNLQMSDKVGILIEALPYIQDFRGKTIVIKYGGSAMDDPVLMESVLRDIVFLEAVGIRTVIVHGGGKAISKAMDAKGGQARFVGGLRVTDAETISIVDDVLTQQINPGLVRRIVDLGGRAQTVSGHSVFRVQKKRHAQAEGEMVDLGYVGDVCRCEVFGLQSLVSANIIPVVSPVGDDGTGQAYNINADVAAAEVAVYLKAFKILFLSDVNGILLDPKDPASTLSTIHAWDVEELKKKQVITGGMIPKVDSCVKAITSGVEKVHLLDGRIPHALLTELFTDQGIGTEIVK